MALKKDEIVAKLEEAKVEVPEGATVADLTKLAKDNNVELEPKTEDEQKDSKKNFSYFKNTVHAGLTVQVQKMVKGADGKEVQEVDEQASFEQYYDTWKGDVVRVGYLKTDSPKIVKACENDPTCEAIDEKEYVQAVKGDDKHKALQKAPVPAV